MTEFGITTTYRKQSRIAAKSSLKASIFLAVIGVSCIAIWGFVWYAKVLIGIAAFMLLIALVELGNSMSKQRRQFENSLSNAELAPNGEFDRILSNDEGSRYERRILIEGRVIRIRIPLGIRDRVQFQANQLVATLESGELTSKFKQFKSLESGRNVNFATEIENLEIETLYFGSKKRPHLVEVSFTEVSGGEPWIANWNQDSKEFSDLRIDT